MNNGPKKGLVSVITPFYNAERFLEEAIQSVLGQSYDNWELLLVDDGSADGGTEIACKYAARYPDRIRYVEHPGNCNMGACASRNVGIRHSQGEYVALLDADDVWLPNKLQEQVALMEAYPTAGLVYGRSEYWYDWDESVRSSQENHIPPLARGDVLYSPPILLKLSYPLGDAGAPCPSNFMLRRGTVQLIGGFEESFEAEKQVYEDQAFLAKVYLNVPVFVSDCCWDRHRFHYMSCCATAEREGKEESARRFYFDWLRRYFIQQNVFDPEIWKAIERLTWRYRHPRLFHAQIGTRRAARKVLEIARLRKR
jgi:glycosyltransferase involved in cell wall biosynthesis